MITGSKDIEIETGKILREDIISKYSEKNDVKFEEISSRYSGREFFKMSLVDTQMVFYFRKLNLLKED